MTTIRINGLSLTNKIPGFFAVVEFGASAISLATIPLVLFLCGLKGSSGTATVDQDLVNITQNSDAITAFGSRGELTGMCRAALANGTGFKLVAGAPAPNGSAVAATATITFATNASSTGTWVYWVDGKRVAVDVANNDTPTQQAVKAIAAFNNTVPSLPVVATNSSGVVTLTCDSAGVRGNQLILYQDISSKPTGTTSTLTGGSAVTGLGNVTGLAFASGVGVETMTNMLAITYAQLYDRVVPAQNDATSLAAWMAQIIAKAGPMEGRREHAILSTNGTSSAAISLAQNTLNQARFQLAWLFEGETQPSKVASAIGGVRAAIENVSPNENYDDVVLSGIAPQRFASQVATLATQQACLDAGVTPLRTNTDATVAIVRAITTHSLDGSTPDYRTLDIGQAVTPDYVCRDLALDWTTNRKKILKYVRPEPGESEPSVTKNVETPSTAAAWATGRLRKHASVGFIMQVDTNPVLAEYDYTSNSILLDVPVIPTPLYHAIGVRVAQLSPSA